MPVTSGQLESRRESRVEGPEPAEGLESRVGGESRVGESRIQGSEPAEELGALGTEPVVGAGAPDLTVGCERRGLLELGELGGPTDGLGAMAMPGEPDSARSQQDADGEDCRKPSANPGVYESCWVSDGCET